MLSTPAPILIAGGAATLNNVPERFEAEKQAPPNAFQVAS